MGFSDSSNRSSTSSHSEEEKARQARIEKEDKWMGKGWGGVGDTKWDDRRAWGIGSGRWGMFKREDFGFKPKEKKERK